MKLSKTDVLSVDEARWKAAQQFGVKLAEHSKNAGDDFNHWWYEHFDCYSILRGYHFPNVLEVGCGPHTNLRFILPLITFQRLWLEDPLMNQYMRMKRERYVLRYLRLRLPVKVAELVRRYKATILPEKLEDLSLPDRSMDLVVCINVLDHVQDVSQCVAQIRRVMRPGGILVIGQDLSDEEDFRRCPESWFDIGHPIKMAEDFLDARLGDLKPLYRRILPRDEGRNPKCHYGTYLLIGQQVAK